MKRYDININDLVERYLAGESEKGLADSLGVSRTVIRRRLIETGTPIRGRSEAETVKWSRMSETQRADQTTAAHVAARGRKAPIEERRRVASSVAANWGIHITDEERRLFNWLQARGVEVVPQQRVHIYNCDLGAFPVAVEIFGGNFHWTGTHKTRLPKRFRSFFDRGWHVLVVHITDHFRLSEAAADHIVAYVNQARRNPTMPREYRMIRGESEPMLICTENDEIPDVYPFYGRRNPATGRYESVPR
jgi:hypothetical protein